MYTCISEKQDIFPIVKKLAEDIVNNRIFKLFYSEMKKNGGEVRLYELLDITESVTRKYERFTKQDSMEILQNVLKNIEEYMIDKGWKLIIDPGFDWFIENTSILIFNNDAKNDLD